MNNRRQFLGTLGKAAQLPVTPAALPFSAEICWQPMVRLGRFDRSDPMCALVDAVLKLSGRERHVIETGGGGYTRRRLRLSLPDHDQETARSC